MLYLYSQSLCISISTCSYREIVHKFLCVYRNFAKCAMWNHILNVLEKLRIIRVRVSQHSRWIWEVWAILARKTAKCRIKRAFNEFVELLVFFSFALFGLSESWGTKERKFDIKSHLLWQMLFKVPKFIVPFGIDGKQQGIWFLQKEHKKETSKSFALEPMKRVIKVMVRKKRVYDSINLSCSMIRSPLKELNDDIHVWKSSSSLTKYSSLRAIRLLSIESPSEKAIHSFARA